MEMCSRAMLAMSIRRRMTLLNALAHVQRDTHCVRSASAHSALNPYIFPCILLRLNNNRSDCKIAIHFIELNENVCQMLVCIRSFVCWCCRRWRVLSHAVTILVHKCHGTVAGAGPVAAMTIMSTLAAATFTGSDFMFMPKVQLALRAFYAQCTFQANWMNEPL